MRCKWMLLTATAVFALVFSGCSELLDHSIEINGEPYSSRSESITLSRLDSDDFSVFSEFKNLQYLDISAVDISADSFKRLRACVGDNVEIRWNVPFNGKRIPDTASELSIDSDITSDESYAIRYFHSLQHLKIDGAELDENLYELIKSASDENPGLQIDCRTNIYGVELDNHTEFLDLNNVPIKNPDRICLAIELFPSIKTIEMCDCGLSNEIMQGLREEYPDINFVWTVSFLRYKVRTDIQVFSTLATNLNRPGNSETFSPLFKYCTDLRALDLGHMDITDISEITNLKKLHTLILADNHISDISPIAELKELVYVELFQNRIKDVSPLLELPKLEDLNLCYNVRMQNPTVLTGCTKLKRLYISHCSLDENERKTLQNGIPADCEFNFTAANCVHDGWRTNKNARNTKIREAFKNWRKVKEYPSWDTIIYK